MNGDTQVESLEAERPVKHRRRESDFIVIPPWVWTLVITLILQIIFVAYVSGTVTEKLDGVATRVGRLEAQMDRYFGVKP